MAATKKILARPCIVTRGNGCSFGIVIPFIETGLAAVNFAL